MKNNFAAITAAVLLAASGSAGAVDGASFELGSGNGVDLWRAGMQWKWQKKWFEGGDWHVGGYWDLQLGQWKGASNVTDISLTPTFRLQRNTGYGPYLEGAIGFHYLSSKNITTAKQFSTSFQFGDHIGAGVRFGQRGNWDLGLRLQHVSNGGIKKPNPGINFTLLRLQYHFN